MPLILFFISIASSTLIESYTGVWELTSENLDEALNTQPDLLLELYSHKCGHCKEFTPYYNGIGEHMLVNESSYIARIEVEEHPDILKRFGSESIPVIFGFKNKIHFKYTGNRDQWLVYTWFKDLIKKPLKVYKDRQELVENFNGNTTVVYFGDLFHSFRSGFDELFQKETEYEFAVLESWNERHLNSLVPGVILKTNETEQLFGLTDKPNDFHNFIELNKDIDVREWTEETKIIVFGQKLNSFFFFAPEDRFPDFLPMLRIVAKNFHSDLLFTYLDLNGNHTDHFRRAGLSSSRQPFAAIVNFVFKTTYYICPDNSFTGLQSCVEDFKNHELRPFTMSQPAPLKPIERGVRVLTGDNFQDFVFNVSVNYLVFFYVPGRSDSEENLKVFERVAFELRDEQKLEFGKLAVDTNEVRNLVLEKVPGLKLFPKRNKGGVEYQGHIGKFKIFHFLQNEKVIG